MPNPSQLFLAERPASAPGSAVLCCVEGSRPLLVEVQALVSTSSYGNARRMASGLDQSRLSLLLAVLEKRAGLNLMAEDVFVNVAGGIAVDEPAADLGVLAAVASSVRNRPVAGTHGGVRRGGAGRRDPRASASPRFGVREAAQMGFTPLHRAVRQLRAFGCADGIELVGVKTVSEALDHLICLVAAALQFRRVIAE